VPKRFLLVGGGSGGHVVPLVAVAESLRKLDPTVELMLLGEGQFLISAADQAGLPYRIILAGKARRYFSPLTLLDPFKAIIGFIQSLWHLYAYMPDAVFTKGGYASVMPALAAKLNFIPVYTHESDSIPGLSNRFLGKISAAVFISFESAGKYFKQKKTALVGNPIRPEVVSGDRDTALQYFNLRTDKKTILIAGGSQGAKRINDVILESLVLLVQQYQIIHQCGDSQLQAVQAEVERYQKEGEQSYASMIQANYRLYPFFKFEEMALAYAAADIVISRAGASNLSEIAVLGKPAIIIPITQSTNNHQMQNALEFQKYGAVILEERNISSHILLNQIEELLKPETAAAISAKIKEFAKLDAADKIAQVLLS